MPVCRQCKSGSTIRAHIIPAAFGRIARDADKDLTQLSTSGGRPSKTGLWDNGILCHTCDNKLSVFDSYAVDFLRHHQNAAVQKDGSLIINDVNVMKLLRFGMAVLWRAALSDRREFIHVRLGPYEEQFRQTLFGSAPIPTAFEMLMLRYRSHKLPVHQVICQPVPRKWCGAVYYDFIVLGWKFITKVGRASLPPDMQRFVIQERSTSIFSGNIPFDQTEDFRVLKHLVDLKRQQKASYKPSSLS